MSAAPLSIELSIPSELGYEKIAREAVAAFARRLGFDHERIEDLKTALGEACTNAIEHGNGQLPGLRVNVSCICADGCLTVEVHDQGHQRFPAGAATLAIDRMQAGRAAQRGMGLLLIAALVDEAGFAESHDGGNRFRLALYQRRSAPGA